MPLFDDIRQAALDMTEKLKECPQCGKPISPYEVPLKKRSFQVFECSTCHLRIEIKTRNNDRAVWAMIAVMYAFLFGMLFAKLLGA